MGEENKKSKKLKYEQPRLVKLSGAKGAGDCVNGSGEFTDCLTGNAAGAGCYSGSTPETMCSDGSGVG